jgi:hypothetical protein
MATVLDLWRALEPRDVNVLKAAIALAATVVLSWGLAVRAAGRPRAAQRVRDVLLAVLAAAACAGWWNFGRFQFPGYVQVHEHFHYYMGAKYFAELGYTRLYACTAIADREDGFADRLAGGLMRDLATNEFVPVSAVLQHPESCTDHFSPDRWQAFKRDVAWFRDNRTPPFWRILLTDHGYNATPVWAIAGRALTRLGPASYATIFTLALLDPLLLIVMWIEVWQAFGWRPTAVAMIWWGTNFPARFIWTGGAFLRADWLALAVIGVCLAKRRRFAASGAAIAYAGLLRVFPGLLLSGPLAASAMEWRRTRARAMPAAARQLILGAGIAGVVLIALSMVVVGGGLAGGMEAWKEFAVNSEKHLATPQTNYMGLKTVISFEPSSRAAELRGFYVDTPWDTWTAARHRVFAGRQPLYWLLVFGFAALLIRAVRRQPAWTALILAVGLIPVATELTCYYYAVLLLYGLLSDDSPWIGAALCALSTFTSLVPALLHEDDEIYTTLSVATLLFVLAVTTAFAGARRPAAGIGGAEALCTSA